MIKIGPAGSGMGSLESLKMVHEAGLDALEVEFTYGVWMKEKDAILFGKEAKRLNVSLSVHAPYYINLASKEKEKVLASMKRIMDSSNIAEHLGAKAVVFHAGFYQGKSRSEVYGEIKDAVIHLLEWLDEGKIKARLCPEVTGKASQFGSVEELLSLHDDVGTGITVDFAHLIARGQGNIDYDSVFRQLRRLKSIHAHFSGIEWTAKGEKRHIPTGEHDAKMLLCSALGSGMGMTLINESPIPFEDAVMMKRILEKL